MLAALMALPAFASAADRYWDVNGTGVGAGGTGTWDATSSVWSPNNDGVSGPYSAWNNAALDDAIFGTTPGTVTLAQPITVHSLNFVNMNGWVLTGSSLALGGVNPTITNAGTVTISSVINSASGLIKAGAGALTLDGSNSFGSGIAINGGSLTLNAANSFTGAINATGGGLAIGTVGDAALGSLGNQINLGGGQTLSTSGTISASRTVNLVSGMGNIRGSGLGSVFYTGAGGMNVGDGIALTNNANNYQGQTQFTTLPGWGGDSYFFSSIADLGVASALGAPTTVANGTILLGPGGGQALGASALHYTGTGHSSNRNWNLRPGNYAGGAYLHNSGSGRLTLTGAISATGGSQPFGFSANSADMDLLGVISSNSGRSAVFTAGGGRTIRLGTANTFSGQANIGGAGTVEASLIANVGVAGSLGTGSIFINGGNLSYLGAGESTNKNWTVSNGALNSNGTGALALGGTLAIGGTATLGGSFTGADNIISGVISGAGNLRSAGNSTWTLTGANTYTGSTIVNSGVLRAGTAGAFGASTVAQVNGGTLDLNGFSRTFSTLSGTGGTVNLGSATLTLEAPTGTTASYAGTIAGSGGLTKLGASTQTLTGANTYTGATTIGGGTLSLNFSPAGGPASNIIASASTLNMSGGTLNVIGAAGESNTQTFNGLNISAGNNIIGATSGSGGSTTVNLGTISRTGGLMNFNLPTSGNITTASTVLGGWATVNGTDYAKVVGGNITAFTAADYTNKDNAANWLNNEFITDAAGFFGTVSGSVQLGGLRYTRPVSTTVTVNPGQTLGVDGTIIVAPTVLNTNQVITGGILTGANGGALGIQQNSTGNFTIASQIVDNGVGMGFVKAGTGLVTLINAANSYTGGTTVAQGILSVNNIGNGGVASSIGASSAASSNLLLEGSTLRYTGASTSSDRGFTFAKSGAILGSGIEVSNAAANLSFSGLVTSSDGANFTKSGAGTLTLSNDGNDYTGMTTVTGGLLSVDTLANGGQVSGIGAASAASANLVLDGGGLQYTGTTTSTNRGFTLGAGNGTVDVNNAATTLTVSGAVVQQAGGNRRLTKNGAGTLVLSGTNTYTGGNTVNAGVLRAGSTQAFGALSGAGVMTLANAAGVTLDLNNFSNSIGPLNGGGANGGNVTLGSATLRIASGNGNYSGVISGTGGVWRTDGGNQTFNGCNNTYTGVTNLQGATLTVDCLANGGAASGIGASSNASANLTFTNGNLNYTGGTVSIDRGFNLAGYGVIDVVSGTTLGFSGQVIGGGELYKDNAGTLVLSGNNTYTNNTRVRGGTLRAGSNTAFGTTNSFWLDNTAGALLDLNNFNANAGALIGGGAAGGNITLGTGTLTIRDGLGQTYAGAISGTGNLIKNGGGTQTLSGCNSSYSGTTTINAGVLAVGCLPNGGVNSAMGASSAAPANLVLNGGTLRYTGGGDSTDRQFTLGTNGGTLDASGAGIIEFASSAPVTLAGANTARTLTLTGTNTGYNLLAAQLDNNGAGVTSLTKTGTGTWRLTNANSTYTGVTRINGGVLSVDQLANGGQASSIGASSNAAANLVIGNGSTLRYTGAGSTTDRQFTLDTGVTFIESSGTGALQFTNTGAVTLTGANTARTIALGGTNTGANIMGGAIGDNGTGKTTLAKNDSGTWILTGNNTYTGNTVINNGNLVIGNGGTTGNAGAGNVIVDSPTSTLSLNRSDTFTFNGTLSGPGTLAQIGTGTSVLTSANNSIGATTISAGTLQVNGGLATPTVGMTGASALTINGLVQATGGVPSALTGDAGAQTVTVNTGGTLLANGNLGGGNDTVNLTGTLNTGAGSLQLGDGDDTLVLNDGAQMLGGGVGSSGGSGTDTLVVNTALGYTLDGGKIDTFDILTKQNTGVLTLTGNHDFATGTTLDGGTLDVDGTLATTGLTMADDTTLNVDGVVNAGPMGPVIITGSAGSNTISVAAGGSLSGNGNLGDGADAVTLAGELDTGAGALALGAGDDQLTLHSGAFIIGAGVDAGTGSNDRLVLDNASDLIFDGGQTAGFEFLEKNNAGLATITGTQTFAGGTTINQGALTLAGNFQTPTVAMTDDTALNVEGSLQGGGGTSAVITGSVGDNTVTVGAGGTLLANGDLGAGNDVLDVAGTLDTGAGVFALGDGNDTLTIHENTRILGTVSAGAGIDTFDTHIDTVADLGAVQGFETLSKTGTGVLNINGPLSSDFTTVQVAQGTLNVTAAGDVVPAPGSALTTIVASGATLNVDGSYGCGAGNDTMTVAGTVSGSGTIDLCGGDDTLTLRDGALLGNAISAGLGTADTLVLDVAGALAFDAGNTTNFELLRKDNAGTATLTGSQSFSGGTVINGGTLDVDGALETPTINLADGTELRVDGTVQAGGAAAAVITGSAGINTVTVGVGGTLRASGDLGAGDDVLDVAGTLDTGGGVFALGDGNDNFVVHDGTVVNGTIDGGAGLDTRTYAINTSADLGALVNFEGVTKTGTGVLNITGPGATALQEVQVLQGALDVHAGASVVATAGSALNAIVATGATLNVGGAFGCGGGDDSLNVSGTLSGSGSVNLCGGDDTLVLNDGANLAGLTNPIDGDAGSDLVVLNNAGALALDAGKVANFEVLRKDNTGEAILTGAHSFSGGTLLNGGTLTVAGTLETPAVAMGDDTVLNVDNLLSAGAGAAAVITGSSGANTVNVRQGGLLLASGDLGDGDDVLNVSGTLDTAGGVLSLGAGSDTFTIHDGTVVRGTVDGGAGQDVFNPDINTSADLGALTNFEVLTKTGSGVLNVNGPAQSDFAEVNVLDGTLNIGPAGGIGGVQHATVAGGATLNLDGNLLFTSGDDTLSVAGTVSGGGMLDMGDGNDTFTIRDGANLTALSTPVSGGAGTDVFVADLVGSATLGGAVDFETLTKTNVGTLNIAGPAPSTFTTVNVEGGTLNIGMAGSLNGVQDATVASGARMVVDGSLRFTSGADRFTVAGDVSGLGTLDMLDGDDTLTLRDGADLSGLSMAIDGGAGTDTLVADIAGNATLGGVANFETLSKTNTGTLTVTGPAPSDFTTVHVDGGTLDIGAVGSVSGVVTTTVAGGAALNVAGNYSGSSGNDTMTIAGAVRGAGVIALNDGDDVVTLNDGADFSGFSGTLDGGAHSGGDTVVLNNAGALTFGAGTVTNFEVLVKTNTGKATLTGTQSFSGGTTLAGGELVVDGALATPTLAMSDDTAMTVNGTLDAGGGAPVVISGSAGANTITIAGTAMARGDLGDGADVLDVAGTLDTGGGLFALGAGDDKFVVHDGTVVNGTVDGGAGLDTRVYDINLAANLGALVNFEGVTKTGTGVLNITGPATTALQEVKVLGGTLNIGPAGSVTAIPGSPLDTLVAAGATLNVDGSYGCGDSNDTMRVGGTVSGTGTIDMCGGEDVLTLQDGAVLAATISGGGHGTGDTVVLDTTSAFTFDAARTINFEVLRKDNLGEATLTGAQDFTGGTVLNGGTLTIAGQLGSPTVTMADDTVLNVNGVLQAIGGTATTITGSAGANTVTVGAGGTLLAVGDLGAGNDVLDVAGKLDTAGGVFALGDGDDTLRIHDGTQTIGTVDGGAGVDTLSAQIDRTANLGPTTNFETLRKGGVGTLALDGNQAYITTLVDQGTLALSAGTSLTSQHTTVSAGATLDARRGSFGGTAGDDTFSSMGTVMGALAFGAGNDMASFVGGDITGLTGLDGGDGGDDRVSFSALKVDADALPIHGWERVSLQDGTAMSLGRRLGLGGGVLAIDASSTLLANAGAAIGGSVENAGTMVTAANRLAISGGYTGRNGALQVAVSPGRGTSGGLDIAGDVAGTTAVTFVSDGTVAAQLPSSIQVISSPNDDAATDGRFVAAGDGTLRFAGSVHPWTFGKQGDGWYLNSAADALLPEIGAYAALPSMAYAGIQDSSRLLFQRMAGIRGDTPRCGADDTAPQRVRSKLIGECTGFWMATTYSDMKMGANPGFAFSGQNRGLYAGVDWLLEEHATRTWRGGVFVGFQEGDYSTSGANSTGLRVPGKARVSINAPTFGGYSSMTWRGGTYVDVTATGQVATRTKITAADGFEQSIRGESVSMNARLGHRFKPGDGWTVEPQLQLGVSWMAGSHLQDASGKHVSIENSVLRTARVAVRTEKVFDAAGGARIRPWVTLGLQDTLGEKRNSVYVGAAGSSAAPQGFANHGLGRTATLEIGVEAEVNKSVNLFLVGSYDKSVGGSKFEQRQANLGVRIKW
ncbi:autotransporter-associated beta strand repeat-containing protein [Variovorax sp. DXTD-1]|uniref:autotransporter-associated beta strand repeat-containing protein n=1 Tax=Variovorax sp. DXTD-1 TaxID=2495592 RepID=UPI0021AF8DD8|nr:autotransporter-associated beta strand repeat-containing protein [Variovorax sp. DXTD-1]